MSRVQAFFLEEAADCLGILTATRDARAMDAGMPDARTLHAAARRLRGNAQLARYAAVARIAERLERRLKPMATGDAPWTDAIIRSVDDDVAALNEAVEAVRDGTTKREKSKEVPVEHRETAGDVDVPMNELEYSGVAALDRAASLREPLEEAMGRGEDVTPILDELFDLIRLGME